MTEGVILAIGLVAFVLVAATALRRQRVERGAIAGPDAAWQVFATRMGSRVELGALNSRQSIRYRMGDWHVIFERWHDIGNKFSERNHFVAQIPVQLRGTPASLNLDPRDPGYDRIVLGSRGGTATRTGHAGLDARFEVAAQPPALATQVFSDGALAAAVLALPQSTHADLGTTHGPAGHGTTISIGANASVHTTDLLLAYHAAIGALANRLRTLDLIEPAKLESR